MSFADHAPLALLIHDNTPLSVIAQGVMGKHALWLPELGVKVPFQFGGKIQKYKAPTEPAYSLDTIAEEVAMLRWLASWGAAPPLKRYVFFGTVISEHPGGWWADPLGAYGYEIEDAATLPLGKFDIGVLCDSGFITGSAGALTDLLIQERTNIVNGYLIDVRRSWHDNLRYLGPIPPMPRCVEDTFDLHGRLRRDGAFPFKDRDLPYQEYFMVDRWFPAERDVVARAGLLRFDVRRGESVVDLGCCTGGFLQYAMLQGAGRCIGLDAQQEYLKLAQALARVNGMNICYRRAELRDPAAIEVLSRWIKKLLPQGLDHLLCLSMAKHIGEDTMWAWVDALGARRTYVETNAVKPGAHPQREGVLARGGVYLGQSQDRNPRDLYLIERG